MTGRAHPLSFLIPHDMDRASHPLPGMPSRVDGGLCHRSWISPGLAFEEEHWEWVQDHSQVSNRHNGKKTDCRTGRERGALQPGSSLFSMGCLLGHFLVSLNLGLRDTVSSAPESLKGDVALGRCRSLVDYRTHIGPPRSRRWTRLWVPLKPVPTTQVSPWHFAKIIMRLQSRCPGSSSSSSLLLPP